MEENEKELQIKNKINESRLERIRSIKRNKACEMKLKQKITY